MKKFICMLIGAVFFLVPLMAHAAVFTVNSTNDAVDAAPGNGVCATAGGQCTLRAAIQESNALGGTNTINLPAGAYTLTIPGTYEYFSATGDLNIINGNLTINGAGAATTFIDGSDLDRVISVYDYWGIDPVAAINDITVRNGYGDSGGGIWNDGTLTLNNVIVTENTSECGDDCQGGGIYNSSAGVLIINNSVVSYNSSDYEGGGIYNNGTITLNNCTVSNNNASTVSGDWGYGGAIFNSSGSSFSINNSTLSNNTTDNIGGGIFNMGNLAIIGSTLSSNSATQGTGWGGGLFNSGSASLTNNTVSGNQALNYGAGIFTQPGTTNSIESCTIADNRNLAPSSGAGIFGNGYSAHNIRNTILSNNTNSIGSSNCYQVNNSLGHNISSDGSCYSFNQTGDKQNTDPLLGPLQDNGGPTLTHALLPGSPALDAADPNNFPGTDQRGVARPDGAGPDIGAVEGSEQTDPLPDLTGAWKEPVTENCRTKKGELACKVKGRLIVRNTGDMPSAAVIVRFYLSNDDTVDSGDVLLREKELSLREGILAGSEHIMTFQAALPLGKSLDSGYIIAYIDADDTTDESNEINNFIINGQQQ